MRAILRALRDQFGADQVQALADIVRVATEVRDPLSAVNAIQWSRLQRLLEPVRRLLEDELLAGGRAGVGELPTRMRLDLAFNDTDQRALLFAQTQGSELIRHVTEEQRQIVRDITAEAVQGRLTWSQAAQRIRVSVGLTPRQQRTVQRVYDAAFEKAQARGWSEARAMQAGERAAARQHDRAVRSRAETIARTEILAAQNAGRYASWQQAVEQGYASPLSVKEWVTAPEGSRRGRPCEVCWPLNGVQVQWNAVFPNGRTMPPGHPRCRCTAVLKPASL